MGKQSTKEAQILELLYGKPAARQDAADPRGEMRAVPVKNRAAAELGKTLQNVHGFVSKPFGYENPPAEMLSTLLGVPAVAKTLERIGYGEPLTTGKGGLGGTSRPREETIDAAIAVAPLAAATKGLPVGMSVKPKGGGGNWLNVDKSLENIKPNAGIDPKDAYELGLNNRGDVAIHNWIDTKLNKYIRNEMGTPEDPIRKLADKGKLHIEPDVGENLTARAQYARQLQGFPEEGFAESKLGADWEALTDSQILNRKAKDIKIQNADEPWVQNLPPDSSVYVLGGSFQPTKMLGFDHIIDELRNATAAGDNLPKVLQIDPAKLDRMSVADVVGHVAKINEWRANQAARAHDEMIKVLEKSPVTEVVKEYPDGYKWVELKLPDNDPKYADELAKALKLEGDSMGHCVGGYCPDVIAGRSRIFSLRDPKGKAHVTVEAMPDSGKPYAKWVKNAPDDEKAAFEDYLQKNGMQDFDEAFADWSKSVGKPLDTEVGYNILQIKGKGNARPVEKYDPYTQDFVINNDWNIVDDIQNTGLRDTNYELAPTLQYAEGLGLKLPRFVPDKDYQQLIRHMDETLESGIPTQTPEALKKYIPTEAAPAYPQQILPAAEADANLAKYLQESAEKERWYTGTSSDIHEFNPALGLEKPGQAGATFASKNPDFSAIFARDATISNPHPERQLTPEQVEMAKKNAEQYFRDTYPDMPEHADEMIKSIQAGKPIGEAEDALMNAYRELMPAGPNIMPVYIRTTNPFDFANPEHVASLKAIYPELPVLNRTSTLELPEVQDAIKKAGFDAFYTAEGGNRNIGVFSPTQLKSAIGNIGTYDVTNPLISKKDGGLVSPPDDFTTPDMSDGGGFFTDPDFARFVMEQPR